MLVKVSNPQPRALRMRGVNRSHMGHCGNLDVPASSSHRPQSRRVLIARLNPALSIPPGCKSLRRCKIVRLTNWLHLIANFVDLRINLENDRPEDAISGEPSQRRLTGKSFMEFHGVPRTMLFQALKTKPDHSAYSSGSRGRT